MSYPILTYSRTLGDFPYDLEALQQAGLRALRLIYKGMTEDAFVQRIEEIQGRIAQHNLQLDILIDLPGSKPIVGNVGSGIDVRVGDKCILVPHTAAQVAYSIPTQGLFTHQSFSTLAVNDVVSIADGELNLLITDITGLGLQCTALTSFFLTSGRSLSIRDKPFTFSANSEKDLQLVQRLQHARVRFLVSFTQSAYDLQQLKAINPAIDAIPKIENVIGEATLAGIMPLCTSVMLGRGDLSMAAHANQQFRFQKQMIDSCQTHQRQLIVATGILAGIGDKGLPTIADVMDYGYLRSMGIDAFLITGTNALHKPFQTLQFMQAFG